MKSKSSTLMSNSEPILYWSIDGILHRENGPSIIIPNRMKQWYLNGVRHREDGPAVVYLNPDNPEIYQGFEWWINGNNITYEVNQWMKNNECIWTDDTSWSDDIKIEFLLTFYIDK